MAIQQIGARYVPKFYNKNNGEWQADSYEALTIVLYKGNTYTSKKPVPASAGNPLDNTEYWASTGNYNGQLQKLQSTIQNVQQNKEDKIYFNVMDYGAVGDGVTDDTEAFQKCINAAIQANGTGQKIFSTTPNNAFMSSIRIPNHNYKISGVLTISSTNDLTDNSAKRVAGIIFEGINGKPNLIGNTQVMFNVIGAFVEFHNIQIQQVSTGIKFQGNFNPYSVIDNVIIKNATEYGIYAANGTYVTKITHCIGFNCNVFIAIAQGSTSVLIENCYASGQQNDKGYLLRGVIYSALIACACDNYHTAYEIGDTNGNNFYSTTLYSCGCENCNLALRIYSNANINDFSWINAPTNGTLYSISTSATAYFHNLYYYGSNACSLCALNDTGYGLAVIDTFRPSTNIDTYFPYCQKGILTKTIDFSANTPAKLFRVLGSPLAGQNPLQIEFHLYSLASGTSRIYHNTMTVTRDTSTYIYKATLGKATIDTPTNTPLNPTITTDNHWIYMTTPEGHTNMRVIAKILNPVTVATLVLDD